MVLRINAAVTSSVDSAWARGGVFAFSAGGAVILAALQAGHPLPPPTRVALYVGLGGLAIGVVISLLVFCLHLFRGLAIEVVRGGMPTIHAVGWDIPGLSGKGWAYLIALPNMGFVSHESRKVALACDLHLSMAGADREWLFGDGVPLLADGSPALSQPILIDGEQDARGSMAFAIRGPSLLWDEIIAHPQWRLTPFRLYLTVRDKRSGKNISRVFVGDIIGSAIPRPPEPRASGGRGRMPGLTVRGQKGGQGHASIGPSPGAKLSELDIEADSRPRDEPEDPGP
jgi:hypothetical protein